MELSLNEVQDTSTLFPKEVFEKELSRLEENCSFFESKNPGVDCFEGSPITSVRRIILKLKELIGSIKD